jgi:hypothetical protein
MFCNTKPEPHHIEGYLQFFLGIIAASQSSMETEKTCPYCKRVHYSSYNAERCAARHDAAGGLTKFFNEQSEEKQKQKSLHTREEIERPYK